MRPAAQPHCILQVPGKPYCLAVKGISGCANAAGLPGRLLDAVAKRDSEDWLLAITTDHGGGARGDGYHQLQRLNGLT